MILKKTAKWDKNHIGRILYKELYIFESIGHKLSFNSFTQILTNIACNSNKIENELVKIWY
jgi:hypothetical protein